MLTIVAIDDDPTTLLIFQRMLGGRYQVETATNAIDGISLGLELKPSLFILDLHLPNVNGVEAVSIIRSMPEICDTPVLMVTANATLAAQQELVSAGIHQIVIKPFTPQSLLEKVTSVILSSNRPQAAAIG